MRIIVFRAIKVMMKYSNGGETTNFQNLYLKEFLSLGTNMLTGVALMQNSIHCFWKGREGDDKTSAQ